MIVDFDFKPPLLEDGPPVPAEPAAAPPPAEVELEVLVAADGTVVGLARKSSVITIGSSESAWLASNRTHA